MTAKPRPAARGQLALEQVPRPGTDGAVLPILHLNGYKIANPTILARIAATRSSKPLRGYGYKPYFVEGDEPATMHQLMAATLDKVIGEIARSSARPAPTAGRQRPRWPMIVLRTPKGWTGPKEIDGKQAEGSLAFPSGPDGERRTATRSTRGARAVAASYRPEELFDEEGTALPELRELAPKGDAADGRQPARQRRPAPARPAAAGLPRLRGRRSQPGRDDRARRLASLGDFLRDVMKLNLDAAELPRLRPRRDCLEPPGRPLRGHRPRLARGQISRTTTTCRPTAG